MKTRFLFIAAICLLFVFVNTANAQTASNFSNPGVEYKRAPYTLKLKKKDKVVRTNRFNAHRKANGNGNKHPYVSKKKKIHKRTMRPNKKYRHRDYGDKAPQTW